MSLRDILKGNGSDFPDIEKMEVMCRSKSVRASALRLILEIESKITETKRRAKKLYLDGKEISPWEAKQLDIFRAIARDFRPLKQMIEKGGQQ